VRIVNESLPWSKPEAPELIVAASGVPVRTGGDRAYYAPAYDSIGMPPAAAFRTPEGYAATLLHELSHNADFRIMPRQCACGRTCLAHRRGLSA